MREMTLRLNRLILMVFLGTFALASIAILVALLSLVTWLALGSPQLAAVQESADRPVAIRVGNSQTEASADSVRSASFVLVLPTMEPSLTEIGLGELI